MQKRTLYFALAIMIIAGCGVPKADFDKLKSENEKLKGELDECKNGAERLIALIESAYNNKDYSKTRHYIELLNSKHPQSPKNADFQILLKKIDKLELEQKKQKEDEEKERIKLRNINNTGIWEINYYVDQFGEYTKKKYIRNRENISGTFSNTATQNSALNVEFLISSSTDIDIQLFEYARNNPVKAISSSNYLIGIKDNEGNKHSLMAVNYSDRLGLNEADSKTVHNTLMKGGKVQFWIKEIDIPTTQYQFTIDKADWYDNAYKKLKGK